MGNATTFDQLMDEAAERAMKYLVELTLARQLTAFHGQTAPIVPSADLYIDNSAQTQNYGTRATLILGTAVAQAFQDTIGVSKDSYMSSVNPDTAYRGSEAGQLVQQPDGRGKDTYMTSAVPGNSYGFDPVLPLGSSFTPQGPGDYIGLLWFDLSSISSDATITAAALFLVIESISVSSVDVRILGQLLVEWNEAQATYYRRKIGVDWDVAGCSGDGDHEGLEISTLTVDGAAEDTEEFTLTVARIQEIITGGAKTNYGWRLYTYLAGSGQNVHFYSSDYATAADRPKLVVDYTTPKEGRLVTGRDLVAGTTCRPLVYPDLSAMPAGATVTAAKLRMWLNSSPTAAFTLEAIRCKRDWHANQDQVTWNSYSTGNAWTTAGAGHANDRDDHNCGTLAIGAAAQTGKWYEVTLTVADIEAMLTGGAWANNGFILESSDEAADTYCDWDSQYQDHPPELIIDYTTGNQDRRVVIKFDLSSVAGRTLTGAKLGMYMSAEESTQALNIVAHRMNATPVWTEAGADWDTYDGSNAWPGGAGADADHEAGELASTAFTATEAVGWKTWVLSVALVQAWLDGTDVNNGIFLKCSSETNDSAYTFSSRDGTKPPVLMLQFSGEDSYMSIPLWGAGDEDLELAGIVTAVEEDGVALTRQTTLTGLAANTDAWWHDHENGVLYVHQGDAGKYGNGTLVAEFVLPLATHSGLHFIPEDHWTGKVFPYKPIIASIDGLRQAQTGLFSGIITIDAGAVTCLNGDGYWDRILGNNTPIGRSVRVLVGGDDLPRSEYRHLFTGVCSGLRFGEDQVSFDLSDEKGRMSRLLPPNNFWTTDYPNLEERSFAVPIPIAYGTFDWLRAPVAVCTDTVTNEFKIADHAIKEITQVWKSTDGAGFQTVDHGDEDLVNATFTLSSYDPNVDIVVVEFKGRMDGDDVLISDPAMIVRDLLTTYGGLSDDDIDAASFDESRQHTEYEMAVYIGGERGQQTLRAVLARICESTLGFIRTTGTGAVAYEITVPPVTSSLDEVTERDCAKPAVMVGAPPPRVVRVKHSFDNKTPNTRRRAESDGYIGVTAEVEGAIYLHDARETLTVETYLTSAAAADVLLTRWAFFVRHPHHTVELVMSDRGHKFAVGDSLKLTGLRGPLAAGEFNASVLTVTRASLDGVAPGTAARVRLTCDGRWMWGGDDDVDWG